MIKEISHHPIWYFNKYDLIFSSENRCKKDIVVINRLIEIKGKNVQEIGAGTGNHAVEILNHKPSSLTLVDYEQEAISILTKRFSECEHVKIEKDDGLLKKRHDKYDLILCMYSIIQQNIDSIYNFYNILNSIMSGMHKDSSFLFEFIDHNISRKLFPDSSKTEIYKTKTEVVTITSKYEDTFTTISYSGILDKDIISYKVKLVNLVTKDILDYVQNSNTKLIIAPLDDFGRRNIACLSQI